MDPSTLTVTLGRGSRDVGEPLSAPVVFASAFRTGGALEYSRHGNPTSTAFEEVVGGLEGGDAVAFASGHAAMAGVFEMLAAGAVVVVAPDAFSGTRMLLDDLQDHRKVTIRFVDTTDIEATAKACTGARLLWLESPSNPLLRVSDIAALAEAAHAAGLWVAVDSTFATPLRQRPLDLGADVVVHSATKLLSGHSDLLMGVAVSRDTEIADQLRTRRFLYGAAPGPMESFLATRGVRTLSVRLERAERSAVELVARLEQHPLVDFVRYPGFGSMISFEVRGGASAADAVCTGVELVTSTTSLGGVESTIERRAKRSFEELTPPGLLRFSVGIEHVDDLWGDLDRALSLATRAPIHTIASERL